METLHSDVYFNKWRSRAPIEHTPIIYINVKRKMGTFKLMMPQASEMVRFATTGAGTATLPEHMRSPRTLVRLLLLNV
jgi:hypothetical protein